MMRLELMTPSLPRKCSTTELHRRSGCGFGCEGSVGVSGAEDGARTRHLKLGRLPLYQMSYFREGSVGLGVMEVWV
jgi:hypothetical protein